MDDVRLFMNRGDFLEETYYSFSYSPIRDEAGNVAGLFCPSTQIPLPKIINARRLRTLSELSAETLMQKTTERRLRFGRRRLSRNPDDVPFAVLYLVDDESNKPAWNRFAGLPEDPLTDARGS